MLTPTKASPLKEVVLDADVRSRLSKSGITPRRFLYTPEFETWVRTGLAAVVATKMWGSNIPAIRQLYAMIEQFSRCERLYIPDRLRCLHPEELGVWELKSGDVRVFGWFTRLDIFVAADGGDAYTIKDEHLYDEKVVGVVQTRNVGSHSFIAGGDERLVITL